VTSSDQWDGRRDSDSTQCPDGEYQFEITATAPADPVNWLNCWSQGMVPENCRSVGVNTNRYLTDGVTPNPYYGWVYVGHTNSNPPGGGYGVVAYDALGRFKAASPRYTPYDNPNWPFQVGIRG